MTIEDTHDWNMEKLSLVVRFRCNRLRLPRMQLYSMESSLSRELRAVQELLLDPLYVTLIHFSGDLERYPLHQFRKPSFRSRLYPYRTGRQGRLPWPTSSTSYTLSSSMYKLHYRYCVIDRHGFGQGAPRLDILSGKRGIGGGKTQISRRPEVRSIDDYIARNLHAIASGPPSTIEGIVEIVRKACTDRCHPFHHGCLEISVIRLRAPAHTQ